MPILTEVIETELIKKIDSIPPETAPEEDNDDDKPARDHMILIGIEKNPSPEDLAKKIEKCGCQLPIDPLKYNFAVLRGTLEKHTTSVLELEDVDYIFIDKNNEPHEDYFDYSFLSNINNKWYAILLSFDQKEKVKKELEELTRLNLPVDDFMKAHINFLTHREKQLKEGDGKQSLVFIQSYLGKTPIKIDCEGWGLRWIINIEEFHPKNYERKTHHLSLEYRKYFAEKFLPFEEEFKNFIAIDNLPKEISHYDFMDLYGKEIKAKTHQK